MRHKNHGTGELIWPQGNMHYSPLISHLGNRRPEEKRTWPEVHSQLEQTGQAQPRPPDFHRLLHVQEVPAVGISREKLPENCMPAIARPEWNHTAFLC